MSADQRGKLEELLRYLLRPPLANNRLRGLSEDELLFVLKRKWDDGTTHILFSPTELIARLAAIVPPKAPFKTMPNGVRCHGVLAPRARLRPLVVLTGWPLQAGTFRPSAVKMSQPFAVVTAIASAIRDAAAAAGDLCIRP